MLWDIFCKVIDNHGDAGVCWRLAAELARRGESVRLWMDDVSMLAWMAPEGEAGVEVVEWKKKVPLQPAGDVVVEAFGCDPPAAFVDSMTARHSLWLNLEYLTAEPGAERNHGLRSPVRAGIEKFFFYPGFTAGTGGLLREHGVLEQHAAFDRGDWLRARGVDPTRATVSLFCYEPRPLDGLLAWVESSGAQLLVTGGRASSAVQALLSRGSARPDIHWLPFMSHTEFDHLLWSCDFNFVRGEDSLVRAIWADRPFVWQLYPQEDGAQFEKLEAFLRWLRPAEEVAALYRAWNGAPSDAAVDWNASMTALRSSHGQGRPHWHARKQALALPELCASLLRFANVHARI